MDKARKTSAQGAIDTFAEVQTPVEPTQELNARAFEHFGRIISSRERATWSKNDLYLATQLALMYVRVEDVANSLDLEGTTLVNARGTAVMNPAFTALMQSVNVVQSLTKTLGLSAPQRGLNSREQRNRNSADAQALDVLNRIADQDLLA
jgi:phage terminase small subunit